MEFSEMPCWNNTQQAGEPNSLQQVNEQKPLVHCITNYVVANFTANGLLAAGASPVMADAVEEVEEMAAKSDALLLNIGTLNDRTLQSMQLAGQSANVHHVPIVLDPVGIGATVFRYEAVKQLLRLLTVRLIRCNAGELAALAGADWAAKGVDSGTGQIDVAKIARQLADNYGCLVIVTGEQDVLTDGTKLVSIAGGHKKITNITGTGCLLSALCAAVLGSSTRPFEDLKNLLTVYKEAAVKCAAAVGTFQINLLNELEARAEGKR